MKLTNGNKIIERNKVDYEANLNTWTMRGWKPYVESKAQPKPQPKGDSEWQKPEENKKSQKKDK